MCERIKELHKRLSLMNEKEYIENFLVYNLSTVIAGIKPSATITFKKTEVSNFDKWNKHGKSFVNSIGLKSIILRESKDSIIFLIYNEEEIERNIFTEEHYEFLLKLGYSEEKSLSDYLIKLQERYSIYKCPHELGIFLGFPINDVIDFMECTKKKCLLCGYWRVYNDFNEAKNTFKRYDFIKDHAVKSILKGNSSLDLVYNLKNAKRFPA